MQIGIVRRFASRTATTYLVAEFVLCIALYFVLAKFSLEFATINSSASPVWPPTGLAIALVLTRGFHLLPAIGIAAFATNLATTGDVGTSLAIGLGNTIEAGAAVYLVNLWAQGPAAFVSPSGVSRFWIIVAIVATPISATVGVIALTAAGHAASSNFFQIWSTWWLGDMAGAIVVAPVITLWTVPITNRWRLGQVEILLTYFLAALVGVVVFSPIFPSVTNRDALAFSAILPLLWSALRQSPRETATVALILSAFAVWGVAANNSPFIQLTLNESFLLLVAFVISATLPSLALSAALYTRDKALLTHEETHRLLIDAISDHAIFMLNPEGRVVSWNPGAERIKGYPEKEILGQNFSIFHTEEDRKIGQPGRALENAERFGKYEIEGWRVRRDGSRFWANVVVTAVRDSSGKLLGFAKVVRDMTEKRDAQNALERTREELFQSQKLEAIGQLTGGIAHDFNNLLMTIASGVRLLDRPNSTEERSQIITAMNQAVEGGRNLSTQLLAFARREPLSPTVIDVGDRLERMKPLLARSLREDIIVEVKCEVGLWPIRVDANQFELTILNLAVNARDAMPSGGMLNISAKNLGEGLSDHIAINVSDTGEGMSDETVSRAFEPFFTTKEPGHGTGLGLSQVYGFANQSNGTASITSKLGKGTTVTLTFPRAVEFPQREEPQEIVTSDSGRILIVEDDDNVAAAVIEMVVGLGYEALRVSDGSAALRLLEGDTAFDLLFTDVVMPGRMNGAVLAQQVRNLYPQIPILLTTGYSAVSMREEDKFPVLQKPYGPGELATAILRTRKSHRD